MKTIDEKLNQIDRLLTLAEQDLANDDGRRWPPPPAPPRNPNESVVDNSSAVDPNDYESAKAYVLAQLPTRPMWRPGTWPTDSTDRRALKLSAAPQNTWTPIRGGYMRREQVFRHHRRDDLPLELRPGFEKDREPELVPELVRYGMKVYALM